MSNALAHAVTFPVKLEDGSVAWRGPSNIALVKYWGKKPNQIPANPSISFTLNNSYTDMQLQWQPRKDGAKGIQLKFEFEGKENPKFAEKIIKFLGSLLVDTLPQEVGAAEVPFRGFRGMPWLEQLNLTIESSNSFPHSAGIASSASSMSALALCLCSMEGAITGHVADDIEFYQQASYLARLASGSAARSIYGALVTWGKIEGLPGTSDEFASPVVTPIHKVFGNYHDAILIVHKGEKEVSSRAGHALMDNHPFAAVRYRQAEENMSVLIKAISEGDLDTFIFIVENEALTLHSLMMTSDPSVVLFKPGTWEIINRLRDFRKKTGHKVCFTLDAGPNVHVLYPGEIKNEVEAFIKQELVVYCSDHYWIADKTGPGPSKV